jgi:peroxiredoxin
LFDPHCLVSWLPKVIDLDLKLNWDSIDNYILLVPVSDSFIRRNKQYSRGIHNLSHICDPQSTRQRHLPIQHITLFFLCYFGCSV